MSLQNELLPCKCGAVPEVVSKPAPTHAYTERLVKCPKCGHRIWSRYSTQEQAVAIQTWNEGRERENAREASEDKFLFDLENSGEKSGKMVQKALARIIRAVEAKKK